MTLGSGAVPFCCCHENGRVRVEQIAALWFLLKGAVAAEALQLNFMLPVDAWYYFILLHSAAPLSLQKRWEQEKV